MSPGHPLVQRVDRVFRDVHAWKSLRRAVRAAGAQGLGRSGCNVRERRVSAAAGLAEKEHPPAWKALHGQATGEARDGKGAKRRAIAKSLTKKGEGALRSLMWIERRNNRACRRHVFG